MPAAAAEARGRGGSGSDSVGGAGAGPVAGSSSSSTGSGGGGGGAGSYGGGRQRRRGGMWEVAADMRDPVFRELSWQLDRWYGEYWGRLEPLRYGRRAQVWALRGAAMPYDWTLRRELSLIHI